MRPVTEARARRTAGVYPRQSPGQSPRLPVATDIPRTTTPTLSVVSLRADPNPRQSLHRLQPTPTPRHLYEDPAHIPSLTGRVPRDRPPRRSRPPTPTVRSRNARPTSPSYLPKDLHHRDPEFPTRSDPTPGTTRLSPAQTCEYQGDGGDGPTGTRSGNPSRRSRSTSTASGSRNCSWPGGSDSGIGTSTTFHSSPAGPHVSSRPPRRRRTVSGGRGTCLLR